MKAVGTKNVWFSFAGRRNTDEDLRVEMVGMPTRPHPAEKGTQVSIPGASGKLWQSENAYDRISVSVPCVSDNENIDAINAWLTGEGDLVFGDEPNRAYHARVIKEFSRTNRVPRLRGQAFTIPFECEPYRYEANPVQDIRITASETSITNPGNIAAAPLLRINGDGDGTLMIGGKTLILDDVDGYIYVDCEAKIVYRGEGTAASPMVLATQHVTGEWPLIKPGKDYVSFTGGVSSVIITPRWRWI